MESKQDNKNKIQEDLLEMNQKVKKIKDLIERNENISCIGVSGEWGSGKSKILKLLKKEKEEIDKNEQYNKIEFDLSKYNCLKDFSDSLNIELLSIMPIFKWLLGLIAGIVIVILFFVLIPWTYIIPIINCIEKLIVLKIF